MAVNLNFLKINPFLCFSSLRNETRKKSGEEREWGIKDRRQRKTKRKKRKTSAEKFVWSS